MTVEEMEQTLNRLGIEVLNTRGDEIQAHCPAHAERTGKDDRNPSWWINADSGAHNCFSCGYKGNLYSLISYIEGVDFEKINDWLGSAANLSSRFERLTKPKVQPIEDMAAVTESMLSAFTDVPTDALQVRGLTASAAAAYGLRWDRLHSNWIIPIRNVQTGVLLGWQEKGHTQRYFNNTPNKVPKSKTLFGFDKYESGDMIVVESPLDVVRLASIGIKGGVATYGATISMFQFNLIRGADRVIFALDNDEAGRSASLTMLHLSEEMHLEALFFNYEGLDVKDVGGMSLAEVESGIKKAKHMAQGLKAVI
jgi:DNA primase